MAERIPIPTENSSVNGDTQPNRGEKPDPPRGDLDNPAMDPDLEDEGIDQEIDRPEEIERKEPEPDKDGGERKPMKVVD
jgi:hypothetical protein